MFREKRWGFRLQRPNYETIANHADWVEHLGKNTQEVKKITRYNGLTKVELGPVATLDQVLALFQAVRKLSANQEATLKTLEPPRLIFHTSSELDEHDLELIKNYTDKQLEAEIKKYLHG